MEWLKAGEPYVPVILALIVLAIVIVILRSAKDTDVTLPFGGSVKAKGSAGPDLLEARLAAARIDLEQYGEVAMALDALLLAPVEQVEGASRQWFSQLATRLAHRLREERQHHYRVAIWLDDPNYPDVFIGIGRGLFDPGDTDMDTLERKNTIGGLAFESPTMTYYCRDRKTDPNFKPRKNIPPSFESVFGLALGDDVNRWGVMTIDARQVNGFPDDTVWLIRRFGELASMGASIWYHRVTPS